MFKLLKEISHDLKPSTLFPALCIGSFLGLLITIVQISFAALIFSGPMSHLTARGAGLTLAGALIVGVITSFYSSFKSMISLPEDAPVAIFSGAAAIIAAQAAFKNGDIFITIVMALILSTLLTAVLMLIVARFRLADFFRYIPYPVIGGFLAGSGWLLVIGGLEVMLGSSLDLTNLGLLLAPDLLLLWLPGTTLAIFIFCLQRKFSHYAILPAALITGVIIFHLVLYFSGLSLDQARENGLLFEKFNASGSLWPAFSIADFNRIDWKALLSSLPVLLTIPFIALVGLLLSLGGIELASKKEINMQREITCNSLCNLFSAFAGSPASYSGLTLSLLGFSTGAYSRLVGLISSLVVALTLIWGAALISVFPKSILGVFLMLIGLIFIWDWVVETRKKMIRSDYYIILSILVIIAWLGFFQGVVLGTLLCVILFVLRISQVPVIKNATNGAYVHSKKSRPLPHYKILQEQGKRINIFELRGYLFFGSVNQLTEEIYAQIMQTKCALSAYALIDFAETTGTDISAVSAFARLLNRMEKDDLHFIFTGVNQLFWAQLTQLTQVEHNPKNLSIISDLEQGLSWAEDQIIEKYMQSLQYKDTRHKQNLLFEQVADQMLEKLNNLEYIEKMLNKLHSYSTEYKLQKNELLLAPDQKLDGFFWVQQGKIRQEFDKCKDKSLVNEYGPGEVINIQGIFHTSTIKGRLMAETGCIVQYFSSANLVELEKNNPEAGAELYALLLKIVLD